MREQMHVVNEDGVTMERIIAESVLGRPLKAGETIRHANGNTLDNRRVNLLFCFEGKETPLNVYGRN